MEIFVVIYCHMSSLTYSVYNRYWYASTIFEDEITYFHFKTLRESNLQTMAVNYICLNADSRVSSFWTSGFWTLTAITFCDWQMEGLQLKYPPMN